MTFPRFVGKEGEISNLLLFIKAKMTNEIFSNLPLFIKYLTIYNYFETQIHEDWVLYRIRVYGN